jgi:glycosyltransferase involved in cell wall biosynthesis
MRVGVIHNLTPGGAHRRLGEQIARFDAEVVELCLSTATPITDAALQTPLLPLAPRVPRPFRAPLRYADLFAVLRAWRRTAARVREVGVDVVYANPCRFLQAPAALLGELPPSLYFCDETRRVDTEEAAKATRNPVTRPLYEPMYRAEREADRRSVARATEVATNSSYTAGEIRRVYGRGAEVVPMGIADVFVGGDRLTPAHILSVGTLIPSKGHDIAIAAVAQSGTGWPLVVVSPREDRGEAARLHAIARHAGVPLEIRIGISDRELAQTYAAAQATLYLAAREPLGLVSLEAQAAGCPVIVSAEGGLPETVGGGWAVPRTAAAVAEKLAELQRDGVREAISAAARAHVAGATWERSAQAVETMLRRLCGS